MTQTYGIYLGSQVTESLQMYADFEMFRGAGLSGGLGLGAYTNADVIRAGPAESRPGPLPCPPVCALRHPVVGRAG